MIYSICHAPVMKSGCSQLEGLEFYLKCTRPKNEVWHLQIYVRDSLSGRTIAPCACRATGGSITAGGNDPLSFYWTSEHVTHKDSQWFCPGQRNITTFHWLCHFEIISLTLLHLFVLHVNSGIWISEQAHMFWLWPNDISERSFLFGIKNKRGPGGPLSTPAFEHCHPRVQ